MFDIPIHSVKNMESDPSIIVTLVLTNVKCEITYFVSSNKYFKYCLRAKYYYIIIL